MSVCFMESGISAYLRCVFPFEGAFLLGLLAGFTITYIYFVFYGSKKKAEKAR